MTPPPRTWVVVDLGGVPVDVRGHTTDPFHPADVAAFERNGCSVVEYVLPPRWIPVGERLPPRDDLVYVAWRKGGVAIINWLNGDEKLVLAWLPLSALPPIPEAP